MKLNNLKQLKIHRILFYLFLFLIPWQLRILFNAESAYVSWYFSYHLATFYYLTDILLLASLGSWVIVDKPFKRPNTLLWLCTTLFIIVLFNVFHVKHIELGLYNAFKWIELLLVTLYVSQTFRVEHHYRVAGSILFISAGIQALLGLVQFHVKHGIGGLISDYIAPLGTPGLATIMTTGGKIARAYGTMPHPNVLGAFLVLGLICGLYLHSTSEKRGFTLKFLLVSCETLIILGIFLSFSRIAWLASALAIVCFTLYYLFHKQKTAVFSIILSVIIASSFIFAFYHETLQARVTDNNPTSFRDRTYFNRAGLEAVRSNPILGVGTGNYIPWMLENYKLLQPWEYQPPHNIYISIAAELGLVGLFLFLALIWKLFSSFKLIPIQPLPFAILCVGVIFILMSQFDHYFVTIQQGRLMFFTVLGLIAALPNLYDKKSD